MKTNDWQPALISVFAVSLRQCHFSTVTRFKRSGSEFPFAARGHKQSRPITSPTLSVSLPIPVPVPYLHFPRFGFGPLWRLPLRASLPQFPFLSVAAVTAQSKHLSVRDCDSNVLSRSLASLSVSVSGFRSESCSCNQFVFIFESLCLPLSPPPSMFLLRWLVLILSMSSQL